MNPECHSQFDELLQLFGCSIKGLDVSINADIDWPQFKKLAVGQGVWHMMSCLVRQKDLAPEDIIREEKVALLQASIRTIKQNETNLQLLRQLTDTGLHPVVMKGMAVAQLYAIPEARDSCDMDFLLPSNEMESAIQFIKSLGYSGEPLHPNMYHVAYVHPNKGMIELHSSLYSDFMEDVWFDKVGLNDVVYEPYSTVEIEGQPVITLGPTDHLSFLSLHLAKHLLCGGISLKMMADAALFLESNFEAVDYIRYWNLMKASKIDGLMRTVYTVMNRYCCLSNTIIDEPADNNQCEALLDDLFYGGNLGSLLKQERQNGWQLFYKEKIVSSYGEGSYKRKLMNNVLIQGGHMLFPSWEYMKVKYPILQKHGWLIPVFWFDRLARKGVHYIFHWKDYAYYVKDKSEFSDEAQKRMEMFKTLGML